MRQAILLVEGKRIITFVGLHGELTVPCGSIIRQGDEELVEILKRFNRTQNFWLPAR